MKKGQKTPKTVDEYIAACPKDVQAILKKVRATIHKAVPDAEEKISHQFRVKKNLERARSEDKVVRDRAKSVKK
jgi:uncharacterized protein YdhG (YjbR/CyaY superfamily)